MTISAHLRDRHSYSLAESIRWAPSEMWRIHETEHQETECDHSHEEQVRFPNE